MVPVLTKARKADASLPSAFVGYASAVRSFSGRLAVCRQTDASRMVYPSLLAPGSLCLPENDERLSPVGRSKPFAGSAAVTRQRGNPALSRVILALR